MYNDNNNDKNIILLYNCGGARRFKVNNNRYILLNRTSATVHEYNINDNLII